MSEVRYMHPEQQPPAQTKRDEDRIQELDEALRSLHRQVSRLENLVRTVLGQMETRDLSIRGRPHGDASV